MENRGSILAFAAARSRLNKKELAKKAGYTRSAYYKHIKNPHLPYHILTAYGKALNYDFTKEVSKMPEYEVEDPALNYGKPKTMEEALTQMEMWKAKYIELLERHNTMIEKHNRMFDQPSVSGR